MSTERFWMEAEHELMRRGKSWTRYGFFLVLMPKLMWDGSDLVFLEFGDVG